MSAMASLSWLEACLAPTKILSASWFQNYSAADFIGETMLELLYATHWGCQSPDAETDLRRKIVAASFDSE